MKSVFLAVFMSVGLAVTSQAKSVETVEAVDLVRYQGQWFEIASIPQSFQKKCLANVTADYKILPDQLVEVLNSCDTSSGRDVAEGRAKIVDTETNAKLKVTFVKLFKWVFAFGGDYWIIDLEPNYNYVVVGHPTREYGWILSRQPSLSMQDLVSISERLKEQGYNTCSFITTRQNGGLDMRVPLCELVKGN